MANDNRLGDVSGRISIKTQGFEKSRQQITQQAGLLIRANQDVAKSAETGGQKVEGALNRIASGFQRATTAAKAFDNTALGKVQKGLDSIKNKIAGISLAVAGLVGLGVKAAQDVKTLTTSIELLTGSAEEAKQIMDDTRKLADKFNSPYLDLLQSAKAFLPLARQNNIQMEDLQKLALKIKAVAPQKTFDEIKFSVSEALSGDFVSIKDAIDLTRSQRDELKKALEDGGPQAVLSGISDILEARGFDDKMLEKFGESGANAFAELRSEVTETLSVAFLPLLNDVVLPLIKAFGNLIRGLRESNPDILKLGAGFTLIVAAATPLIGVLTTLIANFKALKAASAFTGGLGGKLGAIAKGAAVVGGGVIAGAGIAQGLANAGARSGDLGRIASKESGGKGENVMDVLGERIKQIFVILVDQFLHFGHTLAKVALFIWNAGDQIVNIFKLIGSFVREFGATLQSVVGDLLVGISQLIAKIPGAEGMAIGILQAGGDLQRRGMIEKDAALDQRGDAAARLAQGLEVPQSELDRVEANFNALRENVIGGLVGFLFPVEQKAEEVAGDLEDAGETVAAAIGDTPEFIAEQQAEIADAYKTYIEDIKKIDEEKNSALLKANQDFAAEQVKIAQDMADAERKALEDLIKDRDKLLLDFNRDGDKAERERRRDELENMIEFQRRERDDAQAHADKLVDIQKKSQVRQQELLLNLDFKGLFELQQTTNAELEGANQSFAEQRRERLTALDDEKSDMARAFAAEREERQIAFEQALYDRSIAYHAEQADIARQNTEKLAQARQQYTAELAQIQQKHQMELSLRQQAANQEFQFLVMSEKQRTDFLLQEQNRYLQGAAALFSKMGIKAPTSMQSQPLTSSQQQTVQKAMQSAQSIGQNILNSPAAQAISNFLNPVKRAIGGGLFAGQTSVINEGFRNQMEYFHLGSGRTYEMAGGAGLFTPFKSGTIDPGTGQMPQINMPITVQAAPGMDEAALAREVARQVQEQLTGILQQIGAL